MDDRKAVRVLKAGSRVLEKVETRFRVSRITARVQSIVEVVVVVATALLHDIPGL